MNLLSVENIGKSYGERIILHEISFGINQGQKIAFIAKNGTGKTTLLNIIAGSETADEGQIVKRSGLKIAYLSQTMTFNPKLTIEQTILSGDNPVLDVIAGYEKALENPQDIERYQISYDLMEQHQAWDFETQYKQILFKLNLENLDQKIGELSGGQQKRLGLAMCLLEQPELLILDEPTNHLDLDMIEWLENYLNTTKLTLFMVTHDRYFLERVCNEIIELDQGVIYKYTGNYSYFLEKKEERLAIEKATAVKAKNLYKKELEWIRRTPQARTTKSKSRIDAFYETESLAKSYKKDREIELEINMERLGSKIIELHRVSKSFDGKQYLKDFNYVFKKGERIGIIGKNGSGKTTLLNLVAQVLSPDSGKVVIGDTVKIGYYTQKGIKINPGQKVIDVIREFGDFIPLAKGRTLSAGNLLERFLFNRKQQYDFVEKLSGGELKRLYLCTVLIQNPNVLILDEPTNDLDIVTLNILEEFLLDFPGTLLVVSHDRYFMDKIIDHLFILNDTVIRDFPGNYSDFMFEESQKTSKEIKSHIKDDKSIKTTKKPSLSYKEKMEFKQLEKEIETLQKERCVIEQAFVEHSYADDVIYEKSMALEKIIKTIEAKEERWLELSILME